ncbi:hypothetical protein HDU86_001950 [Geranomyces michiganensis]|nr:hypothetical protein HDU86_001950 [Geranomyces michiganensis]
MYNLYLFRNLQTARVLVSTKFRMPNSILAQIGEYRAENKIRGDHWVPFAVLTGIQSPTTLTAIQSRLIPRQQQTQTAAASGAGGRYKLPLPEIQRIPFAPRAPKPEDPLVLQPASVLHKALVRRPPLRQWEVPASVDAKMRELCRALMVVPEVAAEMSSSDAGDAAYDAMSHHRYTLWCERDEYWHRVEESGGAGGGAGAAAVDGGMSAAAGLVWPEFVDHKRLRLLRNRYPLVPGFDPKTLDDIPVVASAPDAARQPPQVL